MSNIKFSEKLTEEEKQGFLKDMRKDTEQRTVDNMMLCLTVLSALFNKYGGAITLTAEELMKANPRFALIGHKNAENMTVTFRKVDDPYEEDK